MSLVSQILVDEDEDAMYTQLLKQPVDTDNKPTKPSSQSKVHANRMCKY